MWEAKEPLCSKNVGVGFLAGYHIDLISVTALLTTPVISCFLLLWQPSLPATSLSYCIIVRLSDRSSTPATDMASKSSNIPLVYENLKELPLLVT